MFQGPSGKERVCEWQTVCVCVCVHACVCICVTMKHQSISRWLSQLGLPQYCIALEQEYDGVEVMTTCTQFHKVSQQVAAKAVTTSVQLLRKTGVNWGQRQLSGSMF